MNTQEFWSLAEKAEQILVNMGITEKWQSTEGLNIDESKINELTPLIERMEQIINGGEIDDEAEYQKAWEKFDDLSERAKDTGFY